MSAYANKLCINLNPQLDMSDADKELFRNNLRSVYKQRKYKSNLGFNFNQPIFFGVYGGRLQLSTTPYGEEVHSIESLDWKLLFEHQTHKGLLSLAQLIAEILPLPQFSNNDNKVNGDKVSAAIVKRCNGILGNDGETLKMFPVKVKVFDCRGHDIGKKRVFPCTRIWSNLIQKGVGLPADKFVEKKSTGKCLVAVKLVYVHMPMYPQLVSDTENFFHFDNSMLYDEDTSIMFSKPWYNETFDEKERKTIHAKNLFSVFQLRGIHCESSDKFSIIMTHVESIIVPKWGEEELAIDGLLPAFTENDYLLEDVDVAENGCPLAKRKHDLDSDAEGSDAEITASAAKTLKNNEE